MDWTTLPYEINDDGLFIDNLSIVERWELPIQEKLAQSVCCFPNMHILEIGYGLGLASNAVRSCGPKSHTVIEAHPQIAQKAKIELPNTTSIIVNRWQDTISWLNIEVFDGIIYDPYPFSANPYEGTTEGTFEFINEFLLRIEGILKKGGRIGFLDFSRNIATNKDFNTILKKYFSSYEIFETPLLIPESCTYATGNTGNVIILIK